MKDTLKKNFLLGVGITNEKTDNILKYILLGLGKKTTPYYVVTPNPEILVYASKHQEFKTILNSARLALCDGIGVIVAGKFLGQPFEGRTTGTDFMEMLCAAVAKKPITVGFLGAGPGVAERAADCLSKKYSGLKVVYAAPEWEYNSYNSYNNYKNYIADVVFVAFGFPKQEQWMAKNLNKNIYRVAIGVGGAFDYINGQAPRAPLVIRLIGFEWLFRLIRQPWRWKRQLALLEFTGLVLKEKFSYAIIAQ